MNATPSTGTYSQVPLKDLQEVNTTHTSNVDESIRWGVSKYTLFKIWALLLSGVSFAVLHHTFYNWLNDQEVFAGEPGASAWTTQEWIIRYGTAFAFLTKTTLAASVALSYKQHIWINLKSRFYSISALNAIYSATSDITMFFNWEFAASTKVAALLALLVWCIPLSALVTPATIIVKLSLVHADQNVAVPSLNFKNDSLYTDSVAGDLPFVSRITVAAASNTNILPMPAFGVNLTYTLEFNGSSLKCDTITDDATAAIISGVNSSACIQFGNFACTSLFLAFTPVESYLETLYGQANYSKLFDECILKAGPYCEYSPNSTVSGMDYAMLLSLGDEKWACSVQETLYKVRFDSSEGSQTVPELLDAKWIGRTNTMISTVLSNALIHLMSGAIGVGSSHDGGKQSTPRPVARTIRTRLQETALIGLVNTSTYNGNYMQGVSNARDISADDRALARNKSLPTLVEELSFNQTLSLFSWPKALSENGTVTSVQSTRWVNKYQYQKRNFWLANGLAIGVSILGVVIGTRALYLNGVSHEADFITAVTTTRNPTLDRLTLGSSLGTGSLRKDFLKTKLKFGVLDGEGERISGMPRAGFGTVGQVSELQKRQHVR